jgi:hypothetical protein
MRITIQAEGEDGKVEFVLTNEDHDNANFVQMIVTDEKGIVKAEADIPTSGLYKAANVFEELRRESLEEQRHYESTHQR